MRQLHRWFGGRRIGWVVALGLVLIAGCGRKATVEGKVSYQGKNLDSGEVTFFDAGGKLLGRSVIEKDGSYKLTCPPGEAKIAVATAQGGGAMGGMGGRVGPPKDMGGPPKDTKPPAGVDPRGLSGGYNPSGGPAVVVPPKYADPGTSGLSYTVTSGDQKHDISIEPK
jgi:hypothetical protein